MTSKNLSFIFFKIILLIVLLVVLFMMLHRMYKFEKEFKDISGQCESLKEQQEITDSELLEGYKCSQSYKFAFSGISNKGKPVVCCYN